MGDLPRGWVQVALNDVVAPSSERVSPAAMPTARYIGMEHVEAHTNKILATVPAATMVSNAVSFAAGNVLYGRMRPYLNKVVRPGFGGLASAEFIVFPESEALELDFLLMRLSSSDFVRFACSQYEGDRPRVKFEQLGKFTLDLPPRAEQTRIVEKLEELLSGLDAGVAELKAAQHKLTRYRQSLLKAAVQGELTAAWRQQHPSAETGAQLLARILTERRARWEERRRARFVQQGKTPPRDWQKKYTEPLQPDTAGLPALPQGWVWASLDQLAEIQGGIQKQPARAPIQNKFPFLRVANVSRGRLVLDEIHEIELFEGEPERFMLRRGDVLIVEGNGSLTEIGRCAVWDGSIANATHQNHLIRARPVGIEGAFIETWLNSPHGIERMTAISGTTSGLYTLSVGKIAKIPIPVPPLTEQEELLLQLATQLSAASVQVNAVERSLKQSTAQRQNLLRAAFSGQLVPQDPADEPASALLARIRAERVAQGDGKKKPRGRRVKETT